MLTTDSSATGPIIDRELLGGLDVCRQLGGLLWQHRTRRNLTQRQLAERIPVSIRGIRDIEQDRCRPRAETVRLIADGLGLDGQERVELLALAGHSTTNDQLSALYRANPIPPPSRVDGLLGRDAELAALHGAFRSAGRPIVTIIGPSGVGKSRLALEVAGHLHQASRFGVLWTSSDEARPTGTPVAPAPLAVVIRSGLDGLLTASGAELGELAGVIGEHPTLLVLDGHDPNEVRMDRVGRLMQRCAGLRVLATADRQFQVPGEQAFLLPPLAVPDHPGPHSPANLADMASIRLLVSRARQVRPELDVTPENAGDIAVLTRCVDGLPAGLQALASWFAMYEPAELRQHAEADPFGLLDDDGAGVRESLGESLTGLTDAERDCVGELARLGTGFSISDAAAVTGLGSAVCARLLRRLLAQGVIRPEAGQRRSRFRVLNLIRCLVSAGD
jgi:predicted ATPase/DNA-binding XRE family transcriptional regulator